MPMVRVSNGGTAATLLWTNSSPSAAFAPQTISLSLSNYDHILIVGKRLTADSITTYTDTLGAGGTARDVYKISGNTGANQNAFGSGSTYRYITISTSGIFFAQGYQGGTARNDAAVPLYIYGLKLGGIY